MSQLQGMTAIVTGGSRGIGRAICVALAQEGANVVTCYAHGADGANETVKLCQEYGVKAEAVKADVANNDDVATMITKVKAEYGSVDILVNNAGITRDGLSFRMKMEDWQNVINVNLTGTFVVTQIVSNAMLKARAGSIINMSSIVGIHGQGGQVNYSASKGGLIAYSKSLAKEVGARGIRVNCIAPGFIETDMTAVLNEELKKSMVDSVPLKRPGKPEDIANAALFLASDLSSYITGQVLGVDGGMGC